MRVNKIEITHDDFQEVIAGRQGDNVLPEHLPNRITKNERASPNSSTAFVSLAQRPKVIFSIRVINRLGVLLDRFGATSGALTEAAVLKDARKLCNLDDFGPGRFRKPLQLLIGDYEQDPHLTYLGKLVARKMLARIVANRMQVHRDLQQHPEILSEKIDSPLFVVGLPRSGTTLMYNLLAQDPASRPLMFWETYAPSRPAGNPDPRIKAAEGVIKGLYRAIPEIQQVHEFDAQGPDECTGLLLNTFATPYFRGRLPGYRAWLFNVGQDEIDQAYVEYRQQLQLIQTQGSAGRWILKSPSHLFGLASLLKTFPDAGVVYLHRNPARCVPSLCSLTNALDTISYRSIDKHEIGRRTLEIVKQLVKGARRAKDSEHGNRIYEVQYDDLIADPVRTVAGVYERFGVRVNPEFETRLTSYVTENPQHKHGVHSYSLEEFGLSEAKLQALES
ncbi:MAG: sulfotransferase [Thiohalocapsa sp.]